MHINRFIINKLQQESSRKEVTILLGPRQVGKTYLLKWLKNQIPSSIKTSYFNLELPENLRFFNDSPENIFQKITQSGQTVFIDEFHYLKNASQLFKAVYDSDLKIKLPRSKLRGI